ncbi:MAG: DUF2752 domain-containing protein [Muribaculaceae bacterium]|nr:DUF2752 domain-containing protein [Muribaculaceae bacterium]
MTSVKPRIKTVVIIGAVLLAGIVYYVADPMKSPFMPRCIFHTITGLQCPGCGSQRLIHALLHADFAGAWRANALLLLMLPYLLLLTAAELWPARLPRLHSNLHSTGAIVTVAVIIAAWFILRNFVFTGL